MVIYLKDHSLFIAWGERARRIVGDHIILGGVEWGLVVSRDFYVLVVSNRV